MVIPAQRKRRAAGGTNRFEPNPFNAGSFVTTLSLAPRPVTKSILN
jgi:hypothetical protein